MCDVAYALQLEQLERLVATERQVAVVLLAAGAEGVEVPDYAAMREQFDAALEAPFESLTVIDPEKADLMDALGLRRAG